MGLTCQEHRSQQGIFKKLRERSTGPAKVIPQNDACANSGLSQVILILANYQETAPRRVVNMVCLCYFTLHLLLVSGNSSNWKSL